MRAVILSLVLLGCGPAELVVGPPDTADTSTPVPLTCDVLEDRYWDALAAIQSCTEASECGQPLQGTSCGCTRDLVARLNADMTDWQAARDAAMAKECEIGGTSVCDCPPADGFDCIDQVCTWNYTY